MLTRILTTWQSAGWIRWVICLPLFLALWNAPLPWVHRHEATESTDAHLASHLRMFHHESHREHEAEDWHWHFAFLWQMMGCEECPTSDQPTHCVLITGDDCPCPSALELLAWDVVERLLSQAVDLARVESPVESGKTPAFIAALRSRQFLDTFLTSVTLRDLLCTARC